MIEKHCIKINVKTKPLFLKEWFCFFNFQGIVVIIISILVSYFSIQIRTNTKNSYICFESYGNILKCSVVRTVTKSLPSHLWYSL